jgi:hypothetical protein
MEGLVWWRQWMVAVAYVLRYPPLWPLLDALLHAALLHVLVGLALARGIHIAVV